VRANVKVALRSSSCGVERAYQFYLRESASRSNV